MGSAQMTSYLRNQLIDHIFRSATYAKPTTLLVALYTVNPTYAAGGTEVNTTGYAKVFLIPNTIDWYATQGQTITGPSTGNSAGGGTTGNATAIVFGTPGANWGVITGFSIIDNGGNMLIWDALTNSKTVNNGDPAPSFPAGMRLAA